MRLRTLALALALSCGVTAAVQAAPRKTTAAVKRQKVKKVGKSKTTGKYKQNQAAKMSKAKPRKVRKTKPSHR